MKQKAAHDELKRGVRGALLRQVILGGQDGLVNVLGIILGVATATNDARFVIIAGIAATFAESISMAAVAYTSTKAQREYYERQLEAEKFEIENYPAVERREVEEIYRKKGFSGKLLKDIVKHITGSKKRWLDEMMLGELKLTETDFDKPESEAFVVGVSAIIGSLVPLFPFFFLPITPAIIASIIVSAIVLFAAGAFKTRETVGSMWKGGVEMAVVGIVAAIAGYAIGLLLGVSGI